MLRLLALTLLLTHLSPARAQVSEERFHQTIQDLVGLYTPEALALGLPLVPYSNWSSDWVNAHAVVHGGELRIYALGGLARHALMTPDAFTLVLCHELGHHFGGAPRETTANGALSLEGQADYFASLKCFRRYAALRPITLPRGVDSRVVDACDAAFSQERDARICVRGLLAAAELARFIDGAFGDGKTSDMFAPSPRVVRATDSDYPSPQCRLDTYVQGTLCGADPLTPMSATDPLVGACAPSLGDTVGGRPACWFKLDN